MVILILLLYLLRVKCLPVVRPWLEILSELYNTVITSNIMQRALQLLRAFRWLCENKTSHCIHKTGQAEFTLLANKMCCIPVACQVCCRSTLLCPKAFYKNAAVIYLLISGPLLICVAFWRNMYQSLHAS